MTRRRMSAAALAPFALALALAAGVAAPLPLTGCSTDPTSGERQFTAFMSQAEEKRIGAAEHPRLVKEYGGLYDDPALQRYVEGIGLRLQRNSERPEPPFTFVVLDSPAVNAIALPGGYVHVTRGLMALANDEAELAGVIAHEIGHVTARHAAERYSHDVVVGVGAAILGAATDSEAVADVAGLAAGAYVQGYSRTQELDADLLGVRYLSRSGYDATAMSSFLETIVAEDRLTRRITGASGAGPLAGLFASHPRTADRLKAAADAAQASAGGERARTPYLEMIDGLAYGDSRSKRVVRIVEVGPDDTVEILAARMALEDYRTERFRVLNGLAPGERLQPGSLVKIVTE